MNTETIPNELKEPIDVDKPKGPEDLLEQNKKQIEYLQRQCRKAGKAILDQEVMIGGLKKDIDRLSEENDNLRRMLDV
jgi:hypothetical protein|tara:strand:+ start:187 stop:420 length:234 start_codon:yes stop_codon:yes gene_type:complete